VKVDSTTPRASHVNTGTSDAGQRELWPKTSGPVLRHPKLLVSAVPDEPVTAHAGLSLAAAVVKRLRIAEEINQRVAVLKLHLPFFESDHVLVHAYNLFVGGSAIEDIGELQGNVAVRRMLGAARLPDPTTAGDFLRRFTKPQIQLLDEAIDAVQDRVWQKRLKKKKLDQIVVDVDSHIHAVYGEKKEGADFGYTGEWSYHPLIVSIAGTGEILRIINRSGNAPSAEGTADVLDEILPMLKRRARQVVVRGDSAFCRADIMQVCEKHEVKFAFVCACHPPLVANAGKIAKSAWKRFRTRAHREHLSDVVKSRRKRRRNRKRRRALQRQKHDLKLHRQWIAEVPHQPARISSTFRLIIRRQLIHETDTQGDLFETWRYRFVLTNITDRPAQDVVDLTYERCDQENVIEQLQNGIAGMRMPTGSAIANDAYLRCVRLAANLKAWISLLAFPGEVIRWKWKRFRFAFVHLSAEVIFHARQTQIRFLGRSRFTDRVLGALAILQT